MSMASTPRSRTALGGLWAPLLRRWPRLCAGASLQLLACVLTLAIPSVIGHVVDRLHAGQTAVESWAVLLLGLAAGLCLARLGSRTLLLGLARDAEHALRTRVFARALTLDDGDGPSSGDLLSRLSGDVYVVQTLWSLGVLSLLDMVFTFGIAVVLMVQIDPGLTAWALLPYPAMVMLGSVLGRGIHVHGKARQEQLGALCAHVQQSLAGIEVIKTHDLEDRQGQRFGEIADGLHARSVSLARARGSVEPVLVAIASLSVVLVLYVGGTAHLEGHLGLGDLVKLCAYLGLLVWPTLVLGWAISLVQRGRVSWMRLDAVMSAAPHHPPGQPMRWTPEGPRIELRGLNVERSGHRVLEDLDLVFPAGSTTAIVGPTGSGKSLLLELLAGTRRPSPGTLTIDGVDVTEVDPRSLRRGIARASQTPTLLSTSIADNVAYGLDDAPPARLEARVAKAIEVAGLAPDLRTLPDGLATVVGERGLALSGGQRQRIALARALASERPILVLDDPLSAVDALTEQAILERLGAWTRGRTTVLVSHRLGAIRCADHIVVLDRGGIAERGRHDELVAADGLYASLYRQQLQEGSA